jgi:hypothetical protein
MNPRTRSLLLFAVLVVVAAVVYSRTGGQPAPSSTPSPPPSPAQLAKPAVQPVPPQPTVGSVAKPPGKPEEKVAGINRERVATARWAPGQLESHFEKHGNEGPYHTAADYDAAARETIRAGTFFTYEDRESDAPRFGFYDRGRNSFVGVTNDGNRITTHFHPNRGESYVRGLDRSTYR